MKPDNEPKEPPIDTDILESLEMFINDRNPEVWYDEDGFLLPEYEDEEEISDGD
jgi:hypothetical protein